MAVTDYTEPLAHGAQAAAVLIGGTWAYAKHLRGRVFKPRAELGVATSALQTSSEAAIVVRVTMSNSGLARIPLERDLSMVLVDTIAAADMRPGLNVRWQEAEMAAPVFEGHGWLEPGETITDDLVVPLPCGTLPQPVAFRVRAWVRTSRGSRKKGVAWSANAVVSGNSLLSRPRSHQPYEGSARP